MWGENRSQPIRPSSVGGFFVMLFIYLFIYCPWSSIGASTYGGGGGGGGEEKRGIDYNPIRPRLEGFLGDVIY